MTFSRKASVRTSLALSCVGSVLLPLGAAHAQEGRSLGGMTVTDTAIDESTAVKQASPKAVRTVRDTPQTITVLGKEVLQQQNLISLQDALSTVPGITFGAGEGGSGYGDSINLRGYSANNDITTDGIRDSAQYSRTDNFNIEQIEVTNGANSVTSGSGSVGGTINLVSKRPLDHDQSIFRGGIGTDNYYRVTADVNKLLTENIAVRLNGMYHHNDVPGREVEQNDRWGIAPSVTFGINGPTQLTVQYLHQQDVNIPQFGVPYFASPSYVGPLPNVDRSAYYGFRNIDTQRIKVDQVNMIFDHAFNERLSLRNYFRYQEVAQFSLADGPEGNFCLPSGFTAIGAVCTTPGLFTASGGSRGNTRDTHNRIAFNQTDLKAVIDTAGIEHTLDFGFSLSRESYTARTGNSQRFVDGTPTTTGYTYPVYNPDAANTYTLPLNFIVGARNYNRVENYAVYLFDAMKLSEHFEINAGARWERNIGSAIADNYITTAGPTFGQLNTATSGQFSNRNSLFSYRVGLIYKPIEAVSIYAAYGNSKTPSQSTINGSCSTVTCNVKPEGAKNYEIGVKAELFDGGLLLTAAAFRNDRDSYKVASNNTEIGAGDQQLDGHSRVNGISLGASGHFTPNWSITANYTYLDSKLIQSVSDYCLANPGPIATTPATNPCGNTLNFRDPAAGAALNQAPRHSGSIYTSYVFPFGLTLGYGATYQGKFALNLPALVTPISATSGVTQQYYASGYLVHNATISYDITKALSAQVNIKNIGDKIYYTRIRGNGSGWATPGDARSAVFTLTYKM